MTAKTPATPLPWFVNGSEGYREIRSDREMTDEERAFYAAKFRRPFPKGERIEGPISQDDYPYITHAANAHPKLVEALRHCARPSNEFDVDAAMLDARSILRELGEDA